ncbi:hypothetical protein, partial [Cyanobium gracile]
MVPNLINTPSPGTGGPLPSATWEFSATQAITYPGGSTSRETNDVIEPAQDGRGPLFQSSARIESSPSVALSSHQVLSDSFAKLTTTATASGSGCCLCKDCSQLAIDTDPAVSGATAQAPIVLSGQVTLASSVDLSKTFELHSNPTATKTIFLDFDGYAIDGTPWENYGNLSLKSFYTTLDST